MSGQPNKYFAFGPYQAEAIGPNGWWGIKNKNGLNVLTFADRPGHVFALEAEAKRLADEWNNGKVFDYETDPYEGIVWPPTHPKNNAWMAMLVLSRRFDFATQSWVSPIGVDEYIAENPDEYAKVLAQAEEEYAEALTYEEYLVKYADAFSKIKAAKDFYLKKYGC
jgi:hypothetical protein